jgi:hypothetical protein
MYITARKKEKSVTGKMFLISVCDMPCAVCRKPYAVWSKSNRGPARPSRRGGRVLRGARPGRRGRLQRGSGLQSGRGRQ